MRARISVGLLFVCLSMGCSSHAPLVPDAGASDAVNQEPDAVGAGFCTPGADQTCNDDPSVSALEGTCAPLGYCECKDGFSLNRKTQHCRAGKDCVAAAADDWPFRMQLDAGGCASRQATTCPSGKLDWMALYAAMTNTCHLPANLGIRVEVEGGCPTLLQAKSPVRTSLVDSEMRFLSCFATQLAKTRFACPVTDCIMAEQDLLY
jgi:hypothetical protein